MCLVHIVIGIWFAESKLPLSPSSLPSCCHWMMLRISKKTAQRKMVASSIFTSMASTLSSCNSCFHLKGRHLVSGLFLLIFATALLLIEFYCPSPMFIGYWFGGVCLLPALSALILGLFGSKKLSRTCFFIDALVFIVSIPVLIYLVKLKPNVPFLFFTSCVDTLLILGRKNITEV